ncbi:MAG: calcium-binding protein [Solirubrobacterales bacterium]
MSFNNLNRAFSTFAATAACLAIFATVAFAAVVTGDDTSENLKGTNGADTITANGGDDKVNAKRGNDTITGDLGNDRLWAGRGDDTVNGGDGNDKLHGGDGNDTQDGGPGDDTIYAGFGVDTSYGGEGNDRLWALARRDASGKDDTKVDTLDGGPGDDTFRARDGEADKITCGEGNDRAFLDKRDVITDATAENPNGSCESVKRQRQHRRWYQSGETHNEQP